MSLTEPLLPQEEALEQKLEEYSNSPLDNLQKSIEKLSFEYGSFEFDCSREMGSYSGEIDDDWNKYRKERKSSKIIKSMTAFENKLAVGRIDGVIKIYNLETREEITLNGHSNLVSCLKVNNSNDRLISGSMDKTIIIWDLEEYSQAKVLKWENEVFCLEVITDNWLFSGTSKNGVIRKWNFDNENKFKDFSSNSDGTILMKSSPNDKILVTAHKDNNIVIWSIDDLQVLAKYSFDKPILDIAISEDSKYIATRLVDSIFLWDVSTRQKLEIETELSNTRFLDFVNGNQIVYADLYEGINVYNIDNKKLSELKDTETAAVAVSSRNSLVYYAQKDGSVVIFDSKTMAPITVLKGAFDNVINMQVTDKEDYLACILSKGIIKIHEINKEIKQAKKDCALRFYEATSIKLTKDGKYAVLCSEEEIKVWSFIEEKVAFSYSEGSGQIEISYDDIFFSFISDNHKSISACSFQDMKLIKLLQLDDSDDSYIVSFSISRDKKSITFMTHLHIIKIFDIEKKSIIATLNKRIIRMQKGRPLHCTLGKEGDSVAFLANKTNNEYTITIDSQNNIVFWSLSEQKIMHSFHIDNPMVNWEIAESINWLFIATNNVLEVWSITQKLKIATIKEDLSPISSLNISEDERLLVFKQGREIKLWDLQQLKELDIIKIEDNSDLRSIEISRDNKHIAILYKNDYVRFWSCEEKKIILALQLPHDNLTTAKFSGDAKFIAICGLKKIEFHYIENYLCNSGANSDPYFVPGLHDKIWRHKFVNWMKKPTKELWEKEFIDVVVYPIGYNLLHSLCITDSVDMLSLALNDGAVIFRDQQNMSPLSYALTKSSRRCIDQILNYVIDLDDDNKLFHCIHQLRDDLPQLFISKTPSLVPFLEVLFRRSADKDLIGFYEITEELPMSIFSPISKIYISAFTGENSATKESVKQNENLVQFWGSPLGYNYTTGSDESLLLVKKMDECDNPEIFQTLYVQSVVREKWDYLWPAIITISVIYWLNLVMMTWHLFDPSIYILSTFIVLNGILALYELLQVITKPADYVSEIWNLIDFLRLVLSITWAIFEILEENVEGLAFAVVLVNFFRGLTYFRAFDFTRFYVRLVLMALSDSVAFLIIFLYSTLAFGILYASLNSGISLSDVWIMAYELNMGNFDNNGFSLIQYSCFTLASLVNVVMMLNLLVSTLGDTFDRFQMIADELNSKEMLQLVVEFESIMFWRRSELAKLNSKGKLTYLQRCDIFQDSNVSDKWQGKIKEISTKIDGYKENILDMKKNMSEELGNVQISLNEKMEDIGGNVKKLEEKVDSLNPKISEMERNIEFLRQDWESKMNQIMETLKEIKQK